MQAIIAKYLPPTYYRASKITARCERGRIIVSYDHGLDAGENMRAACDALCARFDAEDLKKYGALSDKGRWSRPKASGQIPSGEYVFCFIPERVLERKGQS